MDLKALAQNIGGFLGHYSGELGIIAGTLESVVGHLPIDHQDKQRINETLGTLHDAAARVAEGASAMANAPVQEVVVSAEAVNDAVGAYLATHLDAAVKAYLDAHHAGE
jgi:hypothetical protein